MKQVTSVGHNMTSGASSSCLSSSPPHKRTKIETQTNSVNNNNVSNKLNPNSKYLGQPVSTSFVNKPPQTFINPNNSNKI
jgi:hypothetical protein